MIRRKVLERILDERLAPLRDDVAELAGEVRVYHHDAVVVGTTKVADAEKRVTAATAQAAETVRHAEARHADTLAGVRAELAAKVEETALVPWRELRAERDRLVDEVVAVRQRAEAAEFQVAHLTAEVERLGAAWRARGEQLVAVEAQAAEAEQRAEVLEIERDEARRQHDAKTAELLASVQSEEFFADALDALAAAARAVLPDLAHGLPSQPKGGSRSRAKARMEALAALVTPTETTTNQEEPA